MGDIYTTFKDAFPKADKNLDFFLRHLSNQFGEGGKVWEENRYHNVGARTKQDLEGFLLGWEVRFGVLSDGSSTGRALSGPNCQY